jgi:pilus assembly protein CpaE
MVGTSKKEASDKPPFLAFVSNTGDMDVLKSFCQNQDWADDLILQGDIRTAAEYLKKNVSPALLLVELPSAADASAQLDALAEVCDPDTKVLTIGDVNEYSFYVWLIDLGISNYLLKPLTGPVVETAYNKAMSIGGAGGKDKTPAKIIAVVGTRGGVGATTIALNLAGIIATGASKKNVALVDLDPQEGTVSLSLDIEPSRSLRDALEKPDRIDSLFIERVMTKPMPNLSVLSAEESLLEHIKIHENAGDMLLKELRAKFDFVVIDVPRYLNNYARQCLRKADFVLVVTELTLLSLRDVLRLGDLMRESFKMNPPLIVANKVGFATKQEMKVADFEKGINATIVYSIPFMPDVFMPISADIPAVKAKGHVSTRPLYELAAQLVPVLKKSGAKEKKGLGLFSMGKKA